MCVYLWVLRSDAMMAHMARRPFGGGSSDFVDQVDGSGIVHADGTAQVKMYNAPTTGTQITDLTDASSNPILVVTANAFGQLPPFFGPPDGTSQLWADAGGSTRQRLDSSDGATRLSALEASSGRAAAFAIALGGM